MDIFTKKDYNNESGFQTSIWGPSLWHFLHCLSFNYPPNPTNKDKENYYQFLINLGDVLPCASCRKHFKLNLKNTKLTDNVFTNRINFSKWMYDLHNSVNVMLKKNVTLTYANVKKRYEMFRARCLSVPINKANSYVNCTDASIHGTPAKCVLSVVPLEKKCPTFRMQNLNFKRLSYKNNPRLSCKKTCSLGKNKA